MNAKERPNIPTFLKLVMDENISPYMQEPKKTPKYPKS